MKVFYDLFLSVQTHRNGKFYTPEVLDGDEFRESIARGVPSVRGGVRLTTQDLDGDNCADVVVGAGTAAGSRATAYLGRSIGPSGTPPAALDFDTVPGFTGGVFVG